MLIRISRSFYCSNLLKSNPIFLRNLHIKNAVPLAFTEYQKSEPKAHPFIVMHGLFGSKSNWWEMCKKCQQRRNSEVNSLHRNSLCKAFVSKSSPPRKIFSIDSRNHGESPHTDQHSYPLMSDDIAKFLHDRSLEKATILGVRIFSNPRSFSTDILLIFCYKFPE